MKIFKDDQQKTEKKLQSLPKFLFVSLSFFLILSVILGIVVLLERGNQTIPPQQGSQPTGVASEYTAITVKALKENPTAYHNKKIVVSGIHWWASEVSFEESSFGDSINEEPVIEVAVEQGKTKLENGPLNYRYGEDNTREGEGIGEVAVLYGTFHANSYVSLSQGLTTSMPPRQGPFWHFLLSKHKIVADRIVFGNAIDTSVFQQKVLALTDKLTYSVGEEISVVIRNDLKNSEGKDLWISMLCHVPFILQKYTGTKWENYGPYPGKSCISPAQFIKAYEQQQYLLNLKEVYEYTGFSIEPGTYRFSFRYSFVNPNLVGQKVQFFDALSNEFTIGTTKTSQFNAGIVGAYASPGESSKVAVFGDVAYLTDISQGLLAIDVSDPTKPKLLDSLKIGGGGAYAVAIQRESSPIQLLVSGYGNAKIALVDISSMLAETKYDFARKFRLIATGDAKRSVQNIAQYGSNWYLAIDGPEFEMLSDTLKSERIIPATPGGHVLSVEPSSITNKFLAAQGEKGLAIFDLWRGFPILQDTIDVGGYAYDVTAYRGVAPIPFREYVYVITSQELVIVDITMPGNPKIKSRLSLAGTGEAIDLVHGIVAVAMWDKGVEIIDVSNPDNPVSLGIVDTPGRARDVAIQQKGNGYYIYVADDRDDLQIIEFRR